MKLLGVKKKGTKTDAFLCCEKSLFSQLRDLEMYMYILIGVNFLLMLFLYL